MRRTPFLIGLMVTLALSLPAQEKVRNLILMIPDGTSSSILSLARWYKYGVCPADHCRLAVDPHICGMVSTYNSDSPIGDSAPTGSAYATGTLSNTGFVATYPVSSGKDRDLVNVDPLKAYHPLLTILEAAKLQGKSTGLVMTSEFTHATPADFSAHTPRREEKESIAVQMAHNKINVVLGGGRQYLDPAWRKDSLDLFNVLRARHYTLATTLDQFELLTPSDTLVYGLFAENYLPNDLDRNTEEIPSLAEMTRTALKILSSNSNGFFLMVEGSKIDWSAHDNDPVGIITEFLAFDDAVKEAMDFAIRDGYTAVVIVPDHGNSGISLGNLRSDKNYDELPIDDLIKPLKACKATGEEISRLIKENPMEAGEIFFRNTSIQLTSDEVQEVTDAARSTNNYLLPKVVSRLISERTYVGFTTHGHTGEDVMLAVYHPGNYRPKGVITNRALHHYMTEILDIPDLSTLTEAVFCIDTLALKEVLFDIVSTENGSTRLIIRPEKGSKIHATIDASTDYITLFKKDKPVKTISLGSLAIYVKPLGHFFIPKNSGQIVSNEFLR